MGKGREARGERGTFRYPRTMSWAPRAGDTGQLMRSDESMCNQLIMTRRRVYNA